MQLSKSTTSTVYGTDIVIVLNDYQDELGGEEFTFGETESIYSLRVAEEDEERELACR